MSRAIGIAVASFSGVRVAGQLTYVPAHIKNGKKINARVIIPVYKNSHRGTNAKTGEKGRTDSFKFVAWGKLADTCCRSLTQGKAIDVIAEPQSYKGSLFNIDGSLRVDASGQAIETVKTSFTVMSIIFGEDSAKTIGDEIAAGRRPQYWNVPNHPDFQLWTQILQSKQATMWDGRSNKFDNARVVLPQGPGIQLDFSAYTTQPGAPVQQNLPGMVAQTFQGHPTLPQNQFPVQQPSAPQYTTMPMPTMPQPQVNQQPQQYAVNTNTGAPMQRTF